MGFLRGDHTFLANALNHPSTKFLLCNNLQPLIKDKTHLEYVKYKDVEPIIGDPYNKNEEEVINTYNSKEHIPQMIFLGLDEKVQDTLVYKDLYKGQPYFAIDVTPRASVTDACNSLISSLESQGLTFVQGRAMDFVASDGMAYGVVQPEIRCTDLLQPPYMPKPANC